MAYTIIIAAIIILCTASGAGAACRKSTTLAGFESDLAMAHHQLRGVLRIVDGCSFSVRGFDLLAGSDESRWWAASGDDLGNLTLGFQVSDQPLNRTYIGDSITFMLDSNVSWDQIVVLAVWDKTTASDFGHVWIRNCTDEAAEPQRSDLSPSPSPAAVDSGDLSMCPIRRQPTMFDNCLSLSSRYRLRWTLNSDSIDIGLEAAVGSGHYMAFGWANPGSQGGYMSNADVTIAGFIEDGMPFAEDYFISKYSECRVNKDGKVEGVCPDKLYEGLGSTAVVNGTKMVYGHRKDGVTFVRYERLLASVDEKYDVVVNKTENMMVIWALGLINSKDTAFRPYYLPKGHGGPAETTYGYVTLNMSKQVNNCVGPLDAADKEDQDIIIADAKTHLVVSSGPARRNPNPPSPSKVIYINNKETPVLQVERGVPVTFSIQAGHDMPFYITSDPIGGNATARNTTEVIYAGGPESEGVPASPKELVWLPGRKTPEQVYYQSVFNQKMGWKVHIVDGGLFDIYNNSVQLDNQQVSLFWNLAEESISVAVRGEKKSGFLAIGFGDGMVNSFAYVGWIDGEGKGRVNTYWIDGKDANSIHPTSENLTNVRCSSENGIITFEFTRPLLFSCVGRKECDNRIDPTVPLKVVWAMGAQWVEDKVSQKNMHSVTSDRPIQVLLLQGSAEVGKDLLPVLAIHGFMMFVAWGILFPGGILAARYLKHVTGDSWFRLHVYFQYSGIVIMLVGVLFATVELGVLYVSSTHVKFGVAAVVLACIQPMNAYLRPKKPANGEISSTKRVLWEYFHTYIGRSAILVGVAALFSGMKHLARHYGGENIEGLTFALIFWLLVGTVLTLYLEYLEIKRRRNDENSIRGSWVLGDSEEDDDLLHSHNTAPKSEIRLSDAMEVQLEALSR